MVITPEELKARQRCIGASDVGIILGLSPWKTSKELWFDKVHGATFKGNAATKRGNLFEPLVIKQAEEFLGKQIVQDVRYERHYELDGHTVIFAANTDGVVDDGDERLVQYARFMHGEHVPEQVCEAKTARSIDHWGLPGTDAVPDTYLTQVYCQMWCSGATVGWVPVQCGFDWFMYGPIERPKDLDLDNMIHQCARWWVDHVVPQVKPEGPPPKASVLATVPRDEGSAIELDESYATMAENWEKAKRESRKLAAEAQYLKEALIEALDDCEIGMTKNGFLSYHANRNGVRTLKWNRDR